MLVKGLSTPKPDCRNSWTPGNTRSGGAGGRAVDPEKLRARESLRLARAELTRQLENTSHPVRKQQIEAAVAELDKRLGAL